MFLLDEVLVELPHPGSEKVGVEVVRHPPPAGGGEPGGQHVIRDQRVDPGGKFLRPVQREEEPAPTALTTARIARTQRCRQEALYDATLVRRFNSGDLSAFTEIVTRYHARMLRIALGLLRNHADAEEIAQDTFVRAHRALAAFRGESSLAVWLRCITLNLSRNRYWYFFRRRRHVTSSLDLPVSPDRPGTGVDLIPSGRPDPAHEAVTAEFTALVAAGLARLTDDQRAILRLRNELHYSYEAIARLLQLDLGTVKSRISRAREHLRATLAQAYARKLPAGPPRPLHPAA